MTAEKSFPNILLFTGPLQIVCSASHPYLCRFRAARRRLLKPGI
jgi:hypothetical protein